MCIQIINISVDQVLVVDDGQRCMSLIRAITLVTSVFTAGACSNYPLSCNLASILSATGVLLRVSVTNLENLIGGISAPHTHRPNLFTKL